MILRHDVDIRAFNSFGVPCRARHFAVAETVAQMERALAFAASGSLPVQILGGGSNVLFVEDYPGLVLRVRLPGLRLDGDREIVAGAGVDWHDVVVFSLARKLYGLENLALIPGSSGAAPIQNIGAYGVELAPFVAAVDALHRGSGVRRRFNPRECRFAYRDSLFRHPDNPWIILSLTLRLRTAPDCQIHYPALAAELGLGEGGGDPAGIAPEAVCAAVCRLRRRALPDPAQLGNAGSFFKNPVVSVAKYEELRERYPQLPSYTVPAASAGADDAGGEARQVKLSAGWLLELLGWKGHRAGRVAVHDRHCLVLVNSGQARGAEVLDLATAMGDSVLATFGIRLEPEVRIVGQS